MFNYQLSERKRCADDGDKAAIGSVVVLFSQCLMCKWSVSRGKVMRHDKLQLRETTATLRPDVPE